jgi:CheY-like chemotaxis protein
MITIVNDVLDLEKVESGDMVLERVKLDIRHLVHTIHVSQVDRCRKKGVKLISKFDDTVPDVLMGDPTRISQILYNLTSNAIKFTESGSVTVLVSGSSSGDFTLDDCPRHFPGSPFYSPQLETEDINELQPHPFWLEISVIDSGIGIEPDSFSRLFEAYTQEKLSTMRNYGGTGLGLAICKQLAGKMKGAIRVESEVNKGSCFTVLLQLELQQEIANEEDEKKIEPPQVGEERKYSSFLGALPSPEKALLKSKGSLSSLGTSSSSIPSQEVKSMEAYLQGVRVLYADDQPINRKLMERFLKELNPVLICVENGLEAVRCIQHTTNRAKQVSKGLKTLASRVSDSLGRQTTNSPSERIRNMLPENLTSFDIVLLDINVSY